MNTVTIDTLYTEENIFTMEKLWDDLCHHADLMKSPDWHESILKHRMIIAESGDAQYSDWNYSKIKL